MSIKNGPKLKRIMISIATILAIILPPQPVNAQSNDAFNIDTDFNIEYEPGNDYVWITESLSIKANNRTYFLPAQGEQRLALPDFELQPQPTERDYKKESMEVVDRNGDELPIRFEDYNGGFYVYVPDDEDVTTRRPYKITLRYKTHELVNANGNIINLYIPGLPADTNFVTSDPQYGITTRYSFNTTLTVPESAPQASYIKPSTISTQNTNGQRTYSISQEQRVGQSGWIQLGTTQYYYFKLVQQAPKTDTLVPERISNLTDLASTNVYTLPLPKEYEEVKQEVYFQRISPEPKQLKRDEEGNLIAYFDMPANQDGVIEVEGYIVVTNNDNTPPSDMPLSQYQEIIKKDPALRKYILPDQYWESDTQYVKDLANTLAEGRTTIMELVRADYDYIVENFNYSYDKVNSDNPRLGALAALKGSEAVCMEYSDAMIALLRAQGVAARAAIGYGNDPTGAENQIGVDEALAQKIGHQWLQVWIPEYGWYSIDPTWGESGREYLGANLDHILWFTVGDSRQLFIGTGLNSADPIIRDDFQSYDVYLKSLPLGEYPGQDQLKPLSELTTQFKDVQYDDLSFYLKTTPVGKSLVLATPVCAMLIGFLLITTFLFTSVRVRRTVATSRERTL